MTLGYVSITECMHTHTHTHTHTYIHAPDTHTHPPSHYQDELAPNVMAMVQSFNRLALLVPTEILEEATPQARSKVITSFIQVRKFRFHSQFTVFHSNVRLNLVLILIPEEESNLIGHFDLKFTKCQCHRIEIHLQWSANKHFAEVYTFTGACLTLW